MSSQSLSLPSLLALLSGALLAIAHYLFPRNRADSPIHVPHLLPWVGNAVAYSLNQGKFLRQCHAKYGPIYSITLGGRHMTILASTASINGLFKDSSKSFKTDLGLQEVLCAITGISTNLPHIHNIMDRKLFPIIAKLLSPNTNTMGDILSIFNEKLWSKHTRDHLRNTSEPQSLSSFVTSSLYFAMSSSLFGGDFPFETMEDFVRLDNGIPGLLAGFPFSDKKTRAARKRLLEHFEVYYRKYVDAPDYGESEGVSKLMTAFLVKIKEGCLTDKEAAGLLLAFMWGAYSNTFRTCFWTLARIISDQEALDSVRQDILLRYPTKEAIFGIQPFSLIHGEGLPLLHSGIYETLRLSLISSVVRAISKDTSFSVDGKNYVLRKGEYVMGDVRALHENNSIYPNSDQYELKRFLQDPDSPGATGKPPVWGGGAHLCKGRHLALYGIQFFTISLFYRYNVVAVPSSGKEYVQLPTPNPRSIGILRANGDIDIRLQARDGVLDALDTCSAQ